MIRLFLFLFIIVITEYYFYQAIKNILPVKFHRILWIGEGIWILLIVVTLLILIVYRPHQWHDAFRIILSMIMIVEVSKLFGSVFMFLDDIRRSILALLNYTWPSLKNTPSASRSRFFAQLAVFFTWMPLAGFIYGMVRGAYRFKIHEVKLSFPDFPQSFGGLKIIQLSDLHLGSFFSTQPVEKIVEIVNNEKPDIIFFTGDLVNNIADEALPYLSILKKLKAPLGIYSILGNHDYGDYVPWDSIELKRENIHRLISSQREMGWDILLNEHRILQRNDESLAIIGVENWGGNLHFPRYGKLDKAYNGTESVPFKILLSHDPSHWDMEVSKKYKDITLTLSGHTHGFQFGIEWGSIKYSPVQWVYKQWAGLYKKEHRQLVTNAQQLLYDTNKTQYLYVNRGAGFIGYPGRLGIWPEITVIELQKG